MVCQRSLDAIAIPQAAMPAHCLAALQTSQKWVAAKEAMPVAAQPVSPPRAAVLHTLARLPDTTAAQSATLLSQSQPHKAPASGSRGLVVVGRLPIALVVAASALGVIPLSPATELSALESRRGWAALAALAASVRVHTRESSTTETFAACS